VFVRWCRLWMVVTILPPKLAKLDLTSGAQYVATLVTISLYCKRATEQFIIYKGMPYLHKDIFGRPFVWIKMKLGTHVGLGPGHIVLDGDLAPPTERGTAAPTFRPMSIVAERSPISAATAELLFLLIS